MAQWKKVIVSGSYAELAAVTASVALLVGDNQLITNNPETTKLSGSFSGSFFGDGSGLKGVTAAGTISSSIQVDHDQTTNFVANEHIDHSSVSITAGSGLFGGGDITATRILSVDSGSLLPYLSSSIFGTVSGDITITDGGVATIGTDAVELGTNTTGDYVANLGSGTGVTIGSNTGEGSQPTISVDYGSIASTAVEGSTTITLNGTSNEIEITGTAAQALGGGPSYTIGLPDNVSITSDLTVGGNLNVQGDLTYINTANLFVEDKFILLNSGSADPDEAGLIVDEGSGQGHAFVFDSATARWAFTGSLASNATSVAPDAFVAAVIDENVAESSDKAEYQKAGNIKIDTAGEIWIYV